MSKAASNELWSLANQWLPKIIGLRTASGITKKIPQFPSLRNKLYDKLAPDIFLEIAYQNKESGDVIILKDLKSTPVRRFLPNEYIKLYEIATIPVIKYIYTLFYF